MTIFVSQLIKETAATYNSGEKIMYTPLTLANLSELVGKTIEWRAEAYKGNSGYCGIETILEIDLTKRNPIINTEFVDETSDNLHYAFVDDHTLEGTEDAYFFKKADGTNNCLSFSDSDREVFFRIVDEN